MSVLSSPKRERFAQELAKGSTQVEAYEAAGYQPNDGNAAKLANLDEVQARVREITGNAARRAEVSIASVVAELEEARSVARGIEQPASMVAASMGKAKVAGLLADRVEHTGKDGGPIETVDLSETEAARRIAFTLARAAQATQH